MPRKKEAKEKSKIFVLGGFRKRAIARATIKEGTGKITINKKPIEVFNNFHQLLLKEPLIIAEEILKDKLKSIDISVFVKGSGIESQIDASRLAIARALIAYTKSNELKNAYLRYDRMLLVADTRRKEMRKPGDSKARAKRQKSYR